MSGAVEREAGSCFSGGSLMALECLAVARCANVGGGTSQCSPISVAAFSIRLVRVASDVPLGAVLAALG